MKMPYTETKTFEFAGKLYSTEKEVLEAAISDVLGNPGFANKVIINSCDLAPLLARACELGMGNSLPVGGNSA